jgi:hypothetical protein
LTPDRASAEAAPMKRIAIIAVAALGLALGAGAGLAVLAQARTMGASAAGAWTTNLYTGAAAADPFTRAIVARVGLLALNKSETLYFTRTVDDEGAALSSACVYELSGAPPPARWWSFTIYAADNYLPVNSDAAFSVDATTIQKQPDESIRVRVAPSRDGAENWISSRNAGSLDLMVRLYNPDPALAANPAEAKLPAIRKVSCAP